MKEGVYVETPLVTYLRSVVSLTTIILCKFQFLVKFLVGFIWRHYKLDFNVLKMKEHIDHYETLFSSGKYKYLIFELLLCSIHSPPKVNYTFNFNQNGNIILYSIDMFLTYCTLFRFYTVWRLFAKYSTWNNDKAEKVCMECHC